MSDRFNGSYGGSLLVIHVSGQSGNIGMLANFVSACQGFRAFPLIFLFAMCLR